MKGLVQPVSRMEMALMETASGFQLNFISE